MVDTDGQQVLLAAVLGLLVSLGIEQLMTPRPRSLHRRAWPCLALHGGLWLAVYALLVLLLARPWFALVVEAALLLLIVVVNNAKVAALREPFVFQDYEYFTDAIRHPRLYIPFLGWGKVVAATLVFSSAVFHGFWLEVPPVNRWIFSGHLGAVILVGFCALLLLIAGNLGKLTATYNPTEDVIKMGLLASLWCYAKAEWIRPSIFSPFSAEPDMLNEQLLLPHLVAVQSESFFDPRSLFSGIQANVLKRFDALKVSAVAHGRLTVPAWGANTVRTEFAYLSGLHATTLGVHRFNPYRRVVGWGVPTMASYLKKLGYRTICIHPYPASFYGRDRIYPLMGFDDFIDIREFSDSELCGAYIGDAGVAKKINNLLQNATTPLFIHAITMENHGPLHLETVTAADVESLYSQLPPSGCDDLSVYLKHLRNADSMLAMLQNSMGKLQRPASFCWFGDHVPIMERAYQLLGFPDGQTEYLIWQNLEESTPRIANLDAHQLATVWLQHSGLMPKSE